MERVMAQGTFDILHPGHVFYLRESAKLGDELFVVIARDSRIKTRKDVFLNEENRRYVVDALEPVKSAVLGSESSIFDSVEQIQPDVITLGYDQEFEPDDLEKALKDEGFDGIQVVRIGPFRGDGVLSSSQIKAEIKRKWGESVFTSVLGADESESH